MPAPITADLARELHAAEPALTPSQIAARLSLQLGRKVSRQAVRFALSVRHARPGRPTTRGAILLRERDLEPRVLELARAEAEAHGWPLSMVLADACAVGLLPEGEWLARKGVAG